MNATVICVSKAFVFKHLSIFL